MVARTSWRLSLPLLLALGSLATAQTIARDPRPGKVAPAPSDAPEGFCGPTTVSESASQTIVDQLSVTCVNGDGQHFDTSWWRAFDLPDHLVDGPLDICEISVGIEIADAADTTQPLTVNLWDQFDGRFPLTPNRYLLGTTTTAVSDQALTILTVPVTGTAPAFAQLVVEISIPDRTTQGDFFFIGANSAGETGPTYISSVECGIVDPVPIESIGFPDVHVVLNMHGTMIPIVPDALAVGPDSTYVIEVGDAFDVKPSWWNIDAAPVNLTGNKFTLFQPPGLTASILDGTANYGMIAPGGTAQCMDCYSLGLAGTRPPGHADLVMHEVLNRSGSITSPAKDWALHVGGSFSDVPDSNIFYRFIETLLHRGVTAGCGPVTYCPGNPTTREQMAAFVLRAKEGPNYLPPACTPPNLFSDVPDTSPFCRFIEELANRGVVAGCGGGNYCPANPVTREQMAVFVLKTLDPALDPPVCAPPNLFNDVPETSPFCRWIEELASRGVVAGCGGGNYCPTNPVTRQQMGPFLSLTFGLGLYGP